MQNNVHIKEIRALKWCRYAAIVAFIIAALTAAASLSRLQNFTLSGLIDALLVFFLGIGILKSKSRVCAFVLFVYFLFIKIIQIFQLPGMLSAAKNSALIFIISFVLVGLAFLIFLGLGIAGTFMHHKYAQTKINKKHAFLKSLISILYGVATLIIFSFVSFYLRSASDDVKALIMIVPTMTMIFLGFLGVLPIAKKYPMSETPKTEPN
jgi:hypothetical protein